ncbi:MAG: Rpp14/Pop5 family protein [Candidatus Woesearchaeota archaeon]
MVNKNKIKKTKSRLKPLLPSLREKKRYLAFEIISKKPINDFKIVSQSLWSSFLEYLGKFGVSKAGLWILPDKYDAKNQRGLIRVNNKEVDSLKSALIMIKEIQGQDVIIRSVGVSGILKKAENRYLNI